MYILCFLCCLLFHFSIGQESVEDDLIFFRPTPVASGNPRPANPDFADAVRGAERVALRIDDGRLVHDM